MQDESALISCIISGDIGAWHTFVETYSPRIRRTIFRYVKDPEIAGDLYTSLLDKLYSGKLAKFNQKSSLATWLFAVTRNHCRDYYRGTKGVRHLLMATGELKEAEHRFFELHYIQGHSLQGAFESMRAESRGNISYLDIFDYRESIRKAIARKNLGKLLDRLLRPEPEITGLLPSSVEYLLDREEALESTFPSPETSIEGKNLGVAIQNLRAAVLKLPHRDQLVLKLRFEHKRSAREISEILDLGNEKQVYRMLERLYEELKIMLLEFDLPQSVYREVADDIESLCAHGAVWEAEQRKGSRPDSG
jgi:RNA polymerase sigma factor (sigma-70 family)